MICPLEEAFRHRRPGGGTGEPPRRETEGSPADGEGDWRGGTRDRGPPPLEGAPTWRPEDGQERREGWDQGREQAEDLRVHERGRSRERVREEGGRTGHALRGERCPRDRGEPSRGEAERATWSERRERRERQRPARGPQREGRYWEAGLREEWSRDAAREHRRSPQDPAPPGGRETGPIPQEWGSLPAPNPRTGEGSCHLGSGAGHQTKPVGIGAVEGH